MRTFYVFKINKEFKVITKDKPYNLYLALDNIHNMNHSELSLAYKLFDSMCSRFNVKELNRAMFNKLKESDSYTKFNSHHIIYNYFTRENSKLTIKHAYMKIKSTNNNPTFLNILKSIPNLFVVDFYSKDYFWLS